MRPFGHMAVSAQAEEAALLAVDMAAAERRIHSALDAHISDLRQQVESEERAKLTSEVQRQVSSQCMRPLNWNSLNTNSIMAM